MQTTPYMNKLITILASFSEDQRKDVYNYFTSILGRDYSVDMTTNYSPKGKAKKTETEDSAIPLEGIANNSWFNVKTSSKQDLDITENYWTSLLGKDYADKSVKNYKNSKQTKTKESSGQTKSASKVKKNSRKNA